jgi:hypothetical protein
LNNKIKIYYNKPEKSEEILVKEEIKFHLDDYELLGIAYLTNYRLVIKLDKPPQKNIVKYLSNLPKDYFDIPLFHISKLELNSSKRSQSKYIIEIHTKDQRNIRLEIFNEEKMLYNQINKLITPKEFVEFLTFTRKYKLNHNENGSKNGWKIYKMKEEFKRQGLNYSIDNFVNDKELMKLEEDVKSDLFIYKL